MIDTPYYIIYEEKLRHNLEIITEVMKRADVNIIMALKANAVWKTFSIISEYVSSCTASSVNELKLGKEYLGGEVHSYCPVYTEKTFPIFLEGSSHITFNSLKQFFKFQPQVKAFLQSHPEKHISCGLRVNPECSVIETDLYNPCRPGSRFGVKAENLPEVLPEGLDGFHFHALCESDSHDLEKVLKAFERNFSKWFPQIKWINMGGGHLMTREGYDIEHLINLLNDFHARYPHISLIMEPGSAFTWQTGDLVASILDIVENDGMKTAIMDASFTCHMPDCLEMPYKPFIREALPDDATDGITYAIGGNSCLSGDFISDWKFQKPLKEGDLITFKDMNHYTTVKTHMFNGIHHPSIWFKPLSGQPVKLREFTFKDYRDRMD